MGNAAAQKKKPASARLADTLANSLANVIVWVFGLATVAVVFQAAFTLVQSPGHPVSVFGYTNGGALREAWGLTFTGEQAFFTKLGMGALAGMEGAFLAAAEAVLGVLALLMSLLSSNPGGRRFGALVLVAWVGLWLGNSGWLAYQEGFNQVLVAATVLLVFIFACSVQRLGKALKTR